jgi:hypothetical protein
MNSKHASIFCSIYLSTMATGNSQECIKKFFLVWPTPVPDKVRGLFTMVFMTILGLIDYLPNKLTRIDGFHLTISLDLFEDLLKMRDYKLDKVEHIDVICNTIRESKRIKYRFNSNCKEVQFCTINDLIKTLEKAACDKVLDSSDPIDQSTIKAILSLMEDRVHDKRMAIPTHLPSFLQFTTTGVLGLPAKNIDEVAPCFICPSCKLIYHRFYLLGCGHQQCEVCVFIRTK